MSDVSSLVVVMLLMLVTWPVSGQQRQVLKLAYDARQEETAKAFFPLTKTLTHTNWHCFFVEKYMFEQKLFHLPRKWGEEAIISLYIQRSVYIFSILFSIHFWRCWRGEFVSQSTVSLVKDYFLYSSDLNV